MPSISCRVHTGGRPGLMPCGNNGSSQAHWPFVRSPRPTKRDHPQPRSTFATDPSPRTPGGRVPPAAPRRRSPENGARTSRGRPSDGWASGRPGPPEGTRSTFRERSGEVPYRGLGRRHRMPSASRTYAALGQRRGRYGGEEVVGKVNLRVELDHFAPAQGLRPLLRPGGA